jgi:hypothetical protein
MLKVASYVHGGECGVPGTSPWVGNTPVVRRLPEGLAPGTTTFTISRRSIHANVNQGYALNLRTGLSIP